MVAVGTWNLENLYRPGGRFGPKTRAVYDAKLGTLAATITRLAPDVLAVQEVGQPEALAAWWTCSAGRGRRCSRSIRMPGGSGSGS